MTAMEIRSAVSAYYRIRECLNHPQSPEYAARLGELLADIERDCEAATEVALAPRWAKATVGPVLAAGVGAATWMRGALDNAGAALRVFGLTGERALSPASAWGLVRPFCLEPVLSEQSLAAIHRRTGMRLRLPTNPSPLDALDALTKPRNGEFAVKAAHWLAEYFRDHAGADTPFATLYRESLANLEATNATGEMAMMAGPNGLNDRPTREEWESIIHGRVPHARLEVRAGYIVATRFVKEYWERWNVKSDCKKTLASGVALV
jgi:hypothetical protein